MLCMDMAEKGQNVEYQTYIALSSELIQEVTAPMRSNEIDGKRSIGDVHPSAPRTTHVGTQDLPPPP